MNPGHLCLKFDGADKKSDNFVDYCELRKSHGINILIHTGLVIQSECCIQDFRDWKCLSCQKSTGIKVAQSWNHISGVTLVDPNGLTGLQHCEYVVGS